MDLDFTLTLDERLEDRVRVSVLLTPLGAEPVQIEGVAVELVGETGERLSHQLRLPIAGAVPQPMQMTVEVRCLGSLPAGARVQGTAWCGHRQWEVSCPADPGTQLEAHVRGLHPVRSDNDEILEPLACGERDRLARALPWLQPCVPPPLTVVETEETSAEEAQVRAFCDDLGLDDADAAFLEELLGED